MLILWYILLTLAGTHGAKILAVFPLPLISHQKSLLSITKALSLRGHNVTVITTDPLNDETLANHTEIDISQLYQLLKKNEFFKILSTDNFFLKTVILFRKMTLFNSEFILETEAVKNLIRSEDRYDLVLVEALDPIFFAFGWKFKAPVVGRCTYFTYF